MMLLSASLLISYCTGLLEGIQSEAVNIQRENKRNVTSVPKPLTLTEIEENILSLPKVKYCGIAVHCESVSSE